MTKLLDFEGMGLHPEKNCVIDIDIDIARYQLSESEIVGPPSEDSTAASTRGLDCPALRSTNLKAECGAFRSRLN